MKTSNSVDPYVETLSIPADLDIRCLHTQFKSKLALYLLNETMCF